MIESDIQEQGTGGYAGRPGPVPQEQSKGEPAKRGPDQVGIQANGVAHERSARREPRGQGVERARHQHRVPADAHGPATGYGLGQVGRAGVAVEVFGQAIAGAGSGGDEDAVGQRPLPPDGGEQHEHRERQQFQGFFEEGIYRVRGDGSHVGDRRPGQRCGQLNPGELEEDRQRADEVEAHGHRGEHGPHANGAGQASQDE